jgi:hypothetical protein
MGNVQRIVLACVPLLSPLACGGNASIPVGDLEARVRDAVCENEVRCGEFPDQSTCASVFFAQQQLVADVNAGKIIYNGSAAAACLSTFSSLGCTLSDLTSSPTQSCVDAIKGTVPDGGACFDAEECVSQRCNLSACAGAMCCAGTCTATVPVGGACSLSGPGCADGAFCKRGAVGSAGTCTPDIAAGQSCGSLDNCVPGKFCIIVPPAVVGICTNAPSEGEPCPAGFCDARADVCDQTTKTCVRRIAVGGPCASTSACVSYANCNTATMKCVARVGGGGACATPADCVAGLPCTNGICVSPSDKPACI